MKFILAVSKLHAVADFDGVESTPVAFLVVKRAHVASGGVLPLVVVRHQVVLCSAVSHGVTWSGSRWSDLWQESVPLSVRVFSESLLHFEDVLYVHPLVLVHQQLPVFDMILLVILVQALLVDIPVRPYVDDPAQYLLVFPVYPLCLPLLTDVVQTLGGCPRYLQVLLIGHRLLALGNLKQLVKQMLVVLLDAHYLLALLILMSSYLVVHHCALEQLVVRVRRYTSYATGLQLVSILVQLPHVQVVRIQTVECFVDVFVNVLGVDH